MIENVHLLESFFMSLDMLSRFFLLPWAVKIEDITLYLLLAIFSKVINLVVKERQFLFFILIKNV